MPTNVQFAKAIYTAFARGDIPAVLALFDPEIQWRQAEGNPYQPDGAVWVGPQAVVEKLFKRIGSEWEGFAVGVRKLHDAGDHVVMEGRYTGTYKPSGKSIDAQVCHVLRFRDGKLCSFQQYVDTGQLQTERGDALIAARARWLQFGHVQLYGITCSSTAIQERFCSTGCVSEYGSVITTV